MLAALALAATTPAQAQTSGATQSPNTSDYRTPNPRNVPGVIKPLPPKVAELPQAPLAPLADRLVQAGLSLHATIFDFVDANPSLGIDKGNASNSIYSLVGADVDLGKLVGIPNGKLHFEETFFSARNDNQEYAGQLGDNSIGYLSPYNLRAEQLSTLTYEQGLFNNRLNIEAGRTHPDRFFALPTCHTLNTCYNDILLFNAGYVSPLYSMWGGRASYATTKNTYVEVGSFATNASANARSGWDWGQENNPGALTMAEAGYRNDFTNAAYPTIFEATLFYNSTSHTAENAYDPARGDPAHSVHGTSGMVFNWEQYVWRGDDGRTRTTTPTSVALYGGWGFAFDSTVPFRSDLYVGATLFAPFPSRPFDHFGVKLRWEQMNNDFTHYLADANRQGGGSGNPFSRNKGIIELNSHVQIVSAIAIEPVLQYEINPNSYYNPTSAKRPTSGLYAGASLLVPIGAMLGLKPL